MKNRLFKNVLSIQGVRNAVSNYAGFEHCKNAISNILSESNISLEAQSFKVDGFPKEFENLTARIGDKSKPLIVLGAHYDTVPTSPGAGDNGSGIALILEVARHFSSIREKVNLQFVFFSLEEKSPIIDSIEYNIGQKLGVIDKNWHYTKLEYLHARNNFFNNVFSMKCDCFSERLRISLDTIELPDKMHELFSEMYDQMKDFKNPLGHGEAIVIGSNRWLEQNINDLNNLKIALIFDEIATASNEKWTHFSIPPKQLIDMSETYNIDLENGVGNFIVTMGSCGATDILNSFNRSAQDISLPYISLNLPFDYNTALYSGGPFLGSDNEPFWKAGLPSILFTDTGHSGRSKYSHTSADTIEHLNFDFLEKITTNTINIIEQFYGIK